MPKNVGSPGKSEKSTRITSTFLSPVVQGVGGSGTGPFARGPAAPPSITSIAGRSGTGARRREAQPLVPEIGVDRVPASVDLAEHGDGSVTEALRRFKVERALVIGVETDLLFPIEQQQELADGLAAGTAITGVLFSGLSTGPHSGAAESPLVNDVSSRHRAAAV